MNFEKTTEDQDQSKEQPLSDSVVSKIIDGKTNHLICFDDEKDNFIKKEGRNIAHWVLTGKSRMGGSYHYFGAKGIELSQGRELLRSMPEKAKKINDSLSWKHVFQKGTKDIIIQFGGNLDLIAYAWIPSPESINETRSGGRNILLIRVRHEGLKILQEQYERDPTSIYDLLISSLYPNALKPLTEEEIIAAVKEEGPEVIRLTRDPALAEEYQSKLDNLDFPKIPEIIDKSVLKRHVPCKEVEWITKERE